MVALFDSESNARAAAADVRSLGLGDREVDVLLPGQSVSVSQTKNASGLLASTAGATQANDVGAVLVSLGVPDGEARFYASEAQAGRSLVVVNANGRSEEIRKRVLQHGGFDVESRGEALIHPSESGVPGGVGAQPIDITDNWTDVRSRYEMLWQQHYGTTDATWEQMEPLYEYAWQLANQAEYRGRPWSEVEARLEADWPSSPFGQQLAWSDAQGPVRDVWEDVAEEAATGAEGGAARRIAHQGTDQSVAARDLKP